MFTTAVPQLRNYFVRIADGMRMQGYKEICGDLCPRKTESLNIGHDEL
jgi:hypothetical protein